MKPVRLITALVLAFALIVGVGAASVQAASYTKTIRYGPYTIPAAASTTDPRMVTRVQLAVSRPCVDCYIVAFEPDLVYADGSRATLATGAMLHHALITSQFRSDATCTGSWLGLAGERFFASGNERTAIAFPAGYGYRVRWYDSWNLLVDLMNHATAEQTVYFEVSFTLQPTSDNLKPLKPVWLDIDQCGDSEYSIPVGFSDRHWDWKVNVPGRVVAMIGHVHGHGVFVEATNESRGGQSICKSVATLDPTDVHNVLAMSTCVDDPLARIRLGDKVRLHSVYNSTHATDDVMGIMLGWVYRTSG